MSKPSIVVFVAVVSLLAACTSTQTPDGARLPSVLKFQASPASVLWGETAALEWSVKNVDSVTIDPSVGVQSPSGQREIRLTETTTFTLTASNREGTTRSTCVVTIDDKPIIVSFTATPDRVALPESAELAWEVENAANVSIDQGIGPVPPAGTRAVAPEETTIYLLTAIGASGKETKRELTLDVVIKARLEVLRCYADDDNGRDPWRVMGEVVNTGGETAYEGKITLVLLDASGLMVDRTASPLDLNQGRPIPSEMRVSFSREFGYFDDVADVEYTVAWKNPQGETVTLTGRAPIGR